MRELIRQSKRDLGATLIDGNSQQISEVMEMATQERNIQTGHITAGDISEIVSENKRGVEMLKSEKQHWFARTWAISSQ